MNTVNKSLVLYLENDNLRDIEEIAPDHHGVIFHDEIELAKFKGNIFIDYYKFDVEYIVNLINKVRKAGLNLVIVVNEKYDLAKEIINRVDGALQEGHRWAH